MEDTTKIIVAAVMISFAVLSIGLATDFKFSLKSQIFAATFTPIYSNDYEFECCVDDTQSISKSLAPKEFYQCPTTVDSCEVISASYGFYKGHSSCSVQKLFWWDPTTYRMRCSDEIMISSSGLPYVQVAKGDLIYPGYSGILQITIKEHKNKLVFCGTAGCVKGIEVPGTNGCSVNPTAQYDSSGNLITFEKKDISYITPGAGDCQLIWRQGNRHITGNLEEQCIDDSECSGHTYGNYECQGLFLVKYGCRKLPLPANIEQVSGGYAYKLFTPQTSENIVTARCEKTGEPRQVQCCSDNECGAGTNTFCDTNINSPTAFTCIKDKDCPGGKDYECGTELQCNIATKQLLSPVCNAFGMCEKKSIEDIQCCTSGDCSSNSFCDTDYKCKQKSPIQTACPFECCPVDKKFNEQSYSDDQSLYFEKPCDAGKSCQADHTCTATLPPPCVGKDCINPCNYDCKLSTVGILGYPACVYDKITCKVTHFLYWIAGIIIAMFLMTAVILYLKNK